MVRAGLGYLAAVDAAQLGTAAQAECLGELERAEAVLTAARAFILAGFTAGQGYSGDADYSPRAWLIHKTRVSKSAAVAHTAWARRAATHPRVVAALATGSCRNPTAGPSASGPASSPRTAGRPPTRSCSQPPRQGWTCGTWPGWPPRSTSGPGLSCPMRIPPRRSRTARCGW